jgi:hypothetical protein
MLRFIPAALFATAALACHLAGLGALATLLSPVVVLTLLVAAERAVAEVYP